MRRRREDYPVRREVALAPLLRSARFQCVAVAGALFSFPPL